MRTIRLIDTCESYILYSYNFYVDPKNRIGIEIMWEFCEYWNMSEGTSTCQSTGIFVYLTFMQRAMFAKISMGFVHVFSTP